MKKNPSHAACTNKSRSNSFVAHLVAFMTVFGLSLALLHHSVSAASLTPKFTVPAECNVKECGWLEVVKLGSEILSFGIYIAILGATLVIVLAGWKIMTAAGDEGAVKTGKKMLWAAIVGIIVTMSAYMIVQFILNKLGVIDGVRVFI